MSAELTGAAEASPRARPPTGSTRTPTAGRWRRTPSRRRCRRRSAAWARSRGAREPDPGWDEGGADAWRRAACAAADAFAEYGEGRVGGFSIGSFSVTNYRDDGTTGAEVAREAALAELVGTGLCWSGVR